MTGGVRSCLVRTRTGKSRSLEEEAPTVKLRARKQIPKQILAQHAHFTLQAVVEQQTRRDRWPVEPSSPPPLSRVHRVNSIVRLHLKQ